MSSEDCIALSSSQQPKRSLALLWQAMSVLFVLLLIGGTAWLAYSPILETPSDVARSRDTFFIAKGMFRKNPKYWNFKRKQIEKKIVADLVEKSGETIPYLVHEITPEMLISFVTEKLKTSPHSWGSTAFAPKISGSSFLILLSKYETGAWPLPIILSLELEVHMTQEETTLSLHRLRRGSQELSLSQSLTYFSYEQELIKKKFNVEFR